MANSSDHIVARRIKVRGLVQGVGFRPFVYRLALRHKLKGWIANGTDGVEIRIEGRKSSVPSFLEALRHQAPPASHIDEISAEEDVPEGLNDFRILASIDLTDETSEISPDIAVCSDCLQDLKKQEHRHDYPFINCTNCGPRFSIILDFPYDRSNTTMQSFMMCPLCRKEFEEMSDRRFHAQPVACRHCGPEYSLHMNGRMIREFNQILDLISTMLSGGKILAVKGLGGYHLMCDALNEKAVGRLRRSKKHEGKPFAVMFRDPETIREYVWLSPAEEKILCSWQRPIVILKNRKTLAHSVSLGLNTTGVFLPYMPFHHLLFERIRQSLLVLTSGNLAEEPIVIEDQQALSALAGISDAVLTYNRDIYNRTDDSVVRVINDKPSITRRSRGYVPVPVKMPFQVNGIFAAGAELVNCFCIGKNDRAYMSQHIGDLKNAETFEFYTEALDRFKKIFRISPHLAVADLHPDYLSTRYVHNMGLPVAEVQHHHAHIASCMAENALDEPVIGLALDGTGYGTDGQLWGSEFLVCDYHDFERYCHFEYMVMPGGDKAAEEPWRMGISLLYQAFGLDIPDTGLPIIRNIGMERIGQLTEAIDKKINCPLSSGAGRLFDAVAAITGICLHSRHHAEAPMRLESELDEHCVESYETFATKEHISFRPVIRRICDDLREGISPATISAKFHNTVINCSVDALKRIASETGIQKVVLSGGSFQNRYLSEKLQKKLTRNRFQVYTHSKVPCNDGGLALGQLAVAGKRINSCR
ncbi:MAG: carbamoyltransferase HypF [Bacteroidales bacterium]|nr:carbamoyltransferase HypF [Bacteroidales bacterium]